MRKSLYFILIILLFAPFSLFSQEKGIGVEVAKSSANGLTVTKIILRLQDRDGKEVTDKEKENKALKSFAIGVGSSFEINIFDLAINNIRKLDFINTAEYKLYSTGVSENLTIVITAEVLHPDGQKKSRLKGVFAKDGGMKDFPVLLENENSKFSLIMTGGAGTFNDFEAFFQHSAEFTKGSPIAKHPAPPGYASWLEADLELGVGGIIKIGKAPVYPYFGLSGMMTGSTGQDLYTNMTRGFTDFERAYLGVIFTDPRNGFTANISAGKQSFQLNDGFLFSKYSGSANAGPRASLFLSARTSYEKTAILNLMYKSIRIDAQFLEPEELDFSPSNTQYLVTSLGYNDNSSVEAGFAYINILSSNGKYANVNGVNMTKEGLYALNPKLWINSLFGNNSIKLRSEFVYEGNKNFDMGAYAFYASAGYVFHELPLSPKLTYRYSYMSGDDSSTVKYERFDPLLTGGLGNWIQGLNFRKAAGNGNIAAHRVQLDLYPRKDMLFTVDYFYLFAPELFNLGGLPPVSRLNDNQIGQEITFTYKYFISEKFTLIGIFSSAFPGEGIKKAFNTPSYPWTTAQLALFMHIL